MHALIRMAITALAMTLAWGTHAKSAIEVFEAVSRSVVVVQGEDATGKLLSLGSGVVIMNGVVATNCHVTNKAARLKVIYQDKAYPAIARHTDGDRDVCSLTVEGMKAPVATLGYTNTLKVGQRVYAIGAPEGLELTLSEGIVSSLREVTGGRYIQTTAPISPGSSGGGLFDEDGRLLGLPTFYLAEGQQLNFAVPVEWVRELPGRHTALTPAADSELDWLNRAVVLETKKDWQGLVRHALGWTKARPRDASAWYVLGIAYGQVRQPAKEIEAYQQALRIDSQHVDAWYNLGNAYADAGQPAKAIEAYQRALRIDPQYAKAWVNLGVAYAAAGQPAKAIETYQQTLRVDPQYADAWYNLGVAYEQAGQPARAIEAYQQALRVDPQHASAWYNLGNAYTNAGQPTKAIKAYRQALRIDPQPASTWYNLGVVYAKVGQPAKEIEAYQQALRIDSQHVDAWYNLGNAYADAGQPAKAIEAYQRALRIDPQYAKAWVNLGVAYAVEGRKDKVMEIYRQLKTLDPTLAESFSLVLYCPESGVASVVVVGARRA